MGFGSVVILLVTFGFLVLGPKRMHEILQQLGHLKASLDRSTREMEAQFTAEIDGATGMDATSDRTQTRGATRRS